MKNKTFWIFQLTKIAKYFNVDTKPQLWKAKNFKESPSTDTWAYLSLAKNVTPCHQLTFKSLFLCTKFLGLSSTLCCLLMCQIMDALFILHIQSKNWCEISYRSRYVTSKRNFSLYDVGFFFAARNQIFVYSSADC